MRVDLTEATIKKLVASPPESATIFPDAGGPRGLGLRVGGNRRPTFFFRYRLPSLGERKLRIGEWPTWGVKAARDHARELRAAVDLGRDPAAEKQSRIEAAVAAHEAPTVATLFERFEHEHVSKLSLSTQRDYKGVIAHHILPKLGKRKVRDIEHGDVEGLCGEVAGKSKAQAARVRAVMGKAYTLAILWKLADSNPCNGVVKERVQPRDRYLTADELPRLLRVLDGLADNPRYAQTARLVLFLLATGARRGEAMKMRWADVDLEAGVWVKPSAHTKQKRAHRVPLSPAAIGLLQRMRETPANLVGDHRRYGRRKEAAESRAATMAASPYIFPNAKNPADHMGEPKHAWAFIAKQAGLRDFRMHDLRHSFASFIASAGGSLPLIGALLGHSQAATTARYAHLLDAPLRAATSAVGKLLEDARNGR